MIWIKTPFIPANGSTELLIYLSSRNYAVDPNQVFDFYDDFDDGVLTWSCSGYPGTVCKEVDGYLVVDAPNPDLQSSYYWGYAWYEGKTFDRPMVLEARILYYYSYESVFLSIDPQNMNSYGHPLGPGYRYCPRANVISRYNGVYGVYVAGSVNNPFGELYTVYFRLSSDALVGGVYGYNNVSAVDSSY